MRIVGQTSDKLVLKEGWKSSVPIGLVVMFLVFGGILIAKYYLLSPFDALSDLWIGIALVIPGIVLPFFSSAIVIDLDKLAGKLIYSEKWLFGKIGGKAYPISNITGIEMRREYVLVNAIGGSTVKNLRVQTVFVFKDGQELMLGHQKSQGGIALGGDLGSGLSNETAVAQQVQHFSESHSAKFLPIKLVFEGSCLGKDKV